MLLIRQQDRMKNEKKNGCRFQFSGLAHPSLGFVVYFKGTLKVCAWSPSSLARYIGPPYTFSWLGGGWIGGLMVVRSEI